MPGEALVSQHKLVKMELRIIKRKIMVVEGWSSGK